MLLVREDEIYYYYVNSLSRDLSFRFTLYREIGWTRDDISMGARMNSVARVSYKFALNHIVVQ